MPLSKGCGPLQGKAQVYHTWVLGLELFLEIMGGFLLHTSFSGVFQLGLCSALSVATRSIDVWVRLSEGRTCPRLGFRYRLPDWGRNAAVDKIVLKLR